MLRYLGPAALGAMTVHSVRTAANFEDALFNIEKKAGATREEMDDIRRDILDLSTELPVSINDIAAAFERGAAAGIPLEDLKEFSRLTSMVSDAWDMSAEAVGNTFAGFETGLGMAREDLEEFADLINYLADSGIADESDIANFIDRVGASLKNFGMTPEEIAAYGAALLNLKMPAETAARAMDTLVGKLAAPENLSNKSYNALKDIVGDVGEFQRLMAEDANGGMLAFLEKLETLTGQQRISLLGALMGEGFDDEVARMVGGLDEIKRNLEAIEDRDVYVGSIAGLTERRLENLNSQLQLMKNHWDQIAISAGSVVAEPLTDALGAVARHRLENDAVHGYLREQGHDYFERARMILSAGRGSREWQDWARKGGFTYPDDEANEALTQGLLAGDLPDDAGSMQRLPVPRSRPDADDAPIIVPRSEWSSAPASLPIELEEMGRHPMEPLQLPAMPPHMASPPPMAFDALSAEGGVDDQAAAAADRLLEFKRAAEEAGGVLTQGADDAGAALTEGGQEAGRSISDAAGPAGQQFGEAASGLIRSEAASAGSAFGQAAAAEIRTAADGAVRRLEGAAGRLARRRARGNPGRTMEEAGTAE
ncbi:hypothetical protein AY599_18310 [Leptolyngbya valderiana BDU 20041]|nr:hypothetical protein AY599_18310 [Leptolyngbya valderiana BDU 20041]